MEGGVVGVPAADPGAPVGGATGVPDPGPPADGVLDAELPEPSGSFLQPISETIIRPTMSVGFILGS